MRVLQLIDSLEAGGAERIAVAYANVIASDIPSYLCSTRLEGSLKYTIDESVGYLFLNKRKTIDYYATKKLLKYIKHNKITIIHAHSSSYFLACIIKLFHPKIKIIWHNHYGASVNLDGFNLLNIKLGSFLFSAIIAVNTNLKDWAINKLNTAKVVYFPNFVTTTHKKMAPVNTILKGVEGKRVVCLANLRKDKDHLNLLNAFELILEKHPDWTLHLIGKSFRDDYSKTILKRISSNKLYKSVYFYGSCSDINQILQQSTIGVLSSSSEGLPVSLLEYGINNLPTVITNVGECSKVVTHEVNGLVVDKENNEDLSNGICRLIENQNLATIFGEKLRAHIIEAYSDISIKDKVLTLYKNI